MEQHCGDLLEEDLSDTCLSLLPAGGEEIEKGKFTEGSACDSMEREAIGELDENSDDKALGEGVPACEVGPAEDRSSSDDESKPEDEDKGAGKLFVSGDFRENDKEEIQFPVEGRISESFSMSARDFESFDALFNDIAQEIERQMTVSREETTQIEGSAASDASSTGQESEEGGFSSDVGVQSDTEGAAVEDELCGSYKEVEVRTETQLSVEDPAVPSHCVADSDLEREAFDENRSGLDVKPEHVEEGAARLFVSPDWSDYKEDEGRPSAHETGGNPQVRNQEQSASYFKSVLGCDGEMRKGDETEVDEEKEQESATKPADDHINRHEADGLGDQLEGLMADGDANELKDFSGEDFQEAGEMYAELSFDFAARVEAEAVCVAEDLRDVYLEMNTVKSSAEDEVEVTEGHSSSSSDDEIHVSSGKVSGYDRPANEQCHSGEEAEPPRLTSSHDNLTSEHNVLHGWLRSEEPRTTDALAPSDSFRHAAADVTDRRSSGTMSSTNQGSLDDSFFFNTDLEKSGKAELENMDDDEEERNWEQEQERIKAFYKFYDDSDEDCERPGRMIKVQFSPEPLSQVIHYETDSSDSESLRSSSEDNDLSSAKTSDMDTDETVQEASALLDTELPEQKPHQKMKFGWKHKRPNILRLALRTGVVLSVGLLALWFAIKHLGMLQPFPLF